LYKSWQDNLHVALFHQEITENPAKRIEVGTETNAGGYKKMTKLTHKQMKEIALSKPGVKKAYDALKEEFDLFEAMIKARLEAGKTQEDVAKDMKTSTSVVGRLETGGGAHKHSPTYESLRRYANAVNCNLRIVFEPRAKGVFSLKKAHRKEKVTGSGR